MKQAINPPESPEAVGPYSPAVKQGNMLFVSGQIALTVGSDKLEDANIKIETSTVLENLDRLIIAAGFKRDEIIKVSIFVKNIQDFNAVNEVYAAYFSGNQVFPARELIEVSKLPKDANIEISAVAIKT